MFWVECYHINILNGKILYDVRLATSSVSIALILSGQYNIAISGNKLLSQYDFLSEWNDKQFIYTYDMILTDQWQMTGVRCNSSQLFHPFSGCGSHTFFGFSLLTFLMMWKLEKKQPHGFRYMEYKRFVIVEWFMSTMYVSCICSMNWVI